MVSDFLNVFLQHLNGVPKEEDKAFFTFVIPDDREAQFGMGDNQVWHEYNLRKIPIPINGQWSNKAKEQNK